MNIDGMEVDWGRTLWCEDCDEKMDWLRTTGYWNCPACDRSVKGKDLEPDE